MGDGGHLWFLFSFLQEVEKDISKEERKLVMIEKAVTSVAVPEVEEMAQNYTTAEEYGMDAADVLSTDVII